MQVVVDLTDQFCKAYLNDEYAALCRKLAEKLGPRTTIAPVHKQSERLGQRDRPYRWLGQFPAR